jgi:hypothetical protein
MLYKFYGSSLIIILCIYNSVAVESRGADFGFARVDNDKDDTDEAQEKAELLESMTTAGCAHVPGLLNEPVSVVLDHFHEEYNQLFLFREQKLKLSDRVAS